MQYLKRIKKAILIEGILLASLCSAEGEQDGNTAAGGGGWLGRGERIYQMGGF